METHSSRSLSPLEPFNLGRRPANTPEGPGGHAPVDATRRRR
ncbi:hypothetical protein [Corallococcus sp. RDP092CA]